MARALARSREVKILPLFGRLTDILAKRGGFGRSATIMITGTVIAQALPLAISPILTRMFAPSDFGILAIYVAAMSIASIVATGRYDLAVMLVADEDDADALVLLSVAIAIALSLLCALIIALAGDQISRWLKRPDLGVWLYSLPVGLGLTGAYVALTQWLNRRGEYSRLSHNRVLQSVLTGGSTIGAGKLGMSYGGMILGTLIGQFASAAFLVGQFGRGRWRSLFKTEHKDRIRRLVRDYRRHPLHILPGQMLGVVAMQMPVFIVTAAFGPAIAGFYHLAYRVISLPASLVGTAVGDVYRQHASQAYRERGEFAALHLRTMFCMLLLGCVPLLVLLVAAPQLFAWVFGEEWRVAGKYARILSIAAFAQFAFLPVDKAALIVGATRYIMVWNIVMLLLLGLLAYVTLNLNFSMNAFVFWLTVVIAGMYFADTLFEYNFSRGSRMWTPWLARKRMSQ